MLTHIVIFTWMPGTTSSQIAAFREKLDQVGKVVAGEPQLRHGPDLALRPGNGDYALIATFANEAAWRAYQDDPVHQAFVRDVVAPIQAERTAIQIRQGA